MACDPKNNGLDEGQENPFRDPWANFPEQDTDDTASETPDDLSDIPDPEPANVTVCYFGPDRDDSQCIETVEYSQEWGDAYNYPAPYEGSSQYSAPVRYIDLLSADETLPLAPNFVLSELMSVDKGRFGFFSPLVLETLQYIREDLGGPLVVSSAYRNVSYNAGVGGVAHSRHQYGDAVDLQTQMTDLTSLAELCELYVASFVSVYESHVHCDWRNDPLEPAFFDTSLGLSSVIPPQIIWSQDGWTTRGGPFDEDQPMREWAAYNAQGNLLVNEVTRYFSAPDDSQLLTVVIGNHVEISMALGQE